MHELSVTKSIYTIVRKHVEKAIESLPLDKLDLIILENVGNLVCPAESDTGAFNADRAHKEKDCRKTILLCY